MTEQIAELWMRPSPSHKLASLLHPQIHSTYTSLSLVKAATKSRTIYVPRSFCLLPLGKNKSLKGHTTRLENSFFPAVIRQLVGSHTQGVVPIYHVTFLHFFYLHSLCICNAATLHSGIFLFVCCTRVWLDCTHVVRFN